MLQRPLLLFDDEVVPGVACGVTVDVGCCSYSCLMMLFQNDVGGVSIDVASVVGMAVASGASAAAAAAA